MATKKPSFEENMEKLEDIVQKLEGGDVPLEKALSEFKEGISLSKEMQKTLQNAENTLTKVMNDDGSVSDFKRDEGSQSDDAK